MAAATTNPYQRLKYLLGSTDLLIAEIISIDAVAGTSVVEDLNGGRYNVFGTSVTVGNRAYIYGNMIQGTAPNLTITSDVFV